MKIAQVCPYDFSRPGGVKNHIENLSKCLKAYGHEVKVIAPKPNVNKPDIHHFGDNRSLNLGGTKIDINIALGQERRALKKFLEEEAFDIIHFHTFWNPALPYQIRRLSKSKHVATFHDTPKNPFVGKTIMPLAAKGVFKLMDAVISVSKTQASYIDRFSGRRIEIIPNGIDLDLYQQDVRPDSNYQDGKFNLLFLGRLEPRKGLIYALNVFKALKTNYPVRLLIAGDGDERKLAEHFIVAHQLKDIEILGLVSEELKLRLLKTADIYLAPALYGESFGIVLLEAMAAGTPIAGFANDGYRNIITEEMAPFFPKPTDLNGLTEAVESLILDPRKRQQLSKAGLDNVKKYDWKILAQSIIALYDKLLNHP